MKKAGFVRPVIDVTSFLFNISLRLEIIDCQDLIFSLYFWFVFLVVTWTFSGLIVSSFFFQLICLNTNLLNYYPHLNLSFCLVLDVTFELESFFMWVLEFTICVTNTFMWYLWQIIFSSSSFLIVLLIFFKLWLYCSLYSNFLVVKNGLRFIICF